MTDSRAEDALRRQSQMESLRANFDTQWTEVAERVLPAQRSFNNTKRFGGEKLSEKVFDDTAPLALPRYAAALESVVMPKTQQWQALKAPEGTPEGQALNEYFDALTKTLFRARYAAKANFVGQTGEMFMSHGAFGNGVLFIDEDMGRGLRYRCCPLAEIYIATNFQGLIDTVHRRFELTARQWVQKFGDATPATIAKAAEQEPERKFELLHCFKPREDADWSRMDYRGMPYASYYVSFEGRQLLKEEGYRTMRYVVARASTAAGEVYGRGPAMQVLGTIKGVNEKVKTLLRTGQRSADPAILLSDDGSLGPFNSSPGALNYGALGPAGEELAKAFQVGANMPLNQEMVLDDRRVINDAFLVTLFQILVESPQMTATEALIKAEEKGALLGPPMGKVQADMQPMVSAELDILDAAGVLPQMPDELVEAGGLYRIEDTSPLSRLQRAGEGVGILRTLEQAGPLIEADPEAAIVFKGKGPAIIRTLADVNGMPAHLLNSDDEVAALTEAQRQAQQQQSLLEAAPVAADAALSLAKASEIAGRAPMISEAV